MEDNKLSLFSDLSPLEYLRLSKFQAILYNVIHFFIGIPKAIKNFFVWIWKWIKKFFSAIGNDIADIFVTFKNGDWKTDYLSWLWVSAR